MSFRRLDMTATTTNITKTKLVRPLRGGQITIPVEFRRALNLDEETMLRVTLSEGELRIAPVRADPQLNSKTALRALYDYFAPTRDEVLASGITEEELLAEIKAAVAEVRAEHRANQE
jgi:bifunctional DNA-binding transcriptional regulator/antitoxin component of YhaV-PrlF toxin-antitoxin module